ncbi:MAG: hypothetical protein DHS20C05_13620 [Hyphococcus sp.]|nr:MAG: hypothetical protein DHS20C05_13620 [Marinicaulis sp.]
MSSMEAAGLWVGLNILLLIFLSARVGQARTMFKINIGDGDHPEMTKAIRTQGNYIEYAPAAIGGLITLALLGAHPVVIHGLGAVFFLGRIAHLLGLGMNKWGQGRMVGTILTMVTLLVTALALFYFSFT